MEVKNILIMVIVIILLIIYCWFSFKNFSDASAIVFVITLMNCFSLGGSALKVVYQTRTTETQ
jgi:MFS-type transporter involved in bile tolerance (Atg22 family)